MSPSQAWKRIGPALQRRGMLEAIDAVDDTAAGRVILVSSARVETPADVLCASSFALLE